MMECSDLRDEMIEVLYGEASNETVARIEGHLASCPACREEMRGLRGVRQKLSAWTLPTAPRRSTPWLRGLGAAAALLLAFGGGLGLSGTQLRYEGGQLSLRLGRPEAEVERLLAEGSRRLARDKEDAIKASLAPGEEEALLRLVDARILESDRRQEQILRTSLETYSRAAESQRRYDLARVSAGLSYLDGRTGQDAARTAQLVSYVLKAAEEK